MAAMANITMDVRLRRTWPLRAFIVAARPFVGLCPDVAARAAEWFARRTIVEYRVEGTSAWQRVAWGDGG